MVIRGTVKRAAMPAVVGSLAAGLYFAGGAVAGRRGLAMKLGSITCAILRQR